MGGIKPAEMINGDRFIRNSKVLFIDAFTKSQLHAGKIHKNGWWAEWK